MDIKKAIEILCKKRDLARKQQFEWERMGENAFVGLTGSENFFGNQHKVTVDALDLAISALRSMPEIRESDFRNATKLASISESGKPLTVEQLRQMNGSPVWIEKQDNELENSWGIVCLSCNQEYVMSFITVFQGYAMLKVHFSEYGKTWLAYSYPPAHIDRSKWEACRKCRSCWTCKSAIEPVRAENSKCFLCEDSSNYEPLNFCPHCGRPLTEEAWAELERRLRG